MMALSTDSDVTVTVNQLMQHADACLRLAGSRRTCDTLESSWLCLQAVILLENAVQRIDSPLQIAIWGSSINPCQTSRESIHTKLSKARNELHSHLKKNIRGEAAFSNGDTHYQSSTAQWLINVLQYFRNQISPERSTSSVDTPMSTTSSLSVSQGNCDLATSPYGIETRVAERQESFLEKISYEKMLLTFNTSTAAKYGVNVLDARCQKMIEDYRNGNVRFEPDVEALTTHNGDWSSEPTMRSRVTNILHQTRMARRPDSLSLDSAPSASITHRLGSALRELNSKAERLKRRNSATTPVVSWQTAIKQHKSMLSEILQDFNASESRTTATHENKRLDNYSGLYPCDYFLSEHDFAQDPNIITLANRRRYSESASTSSCSSNGGGVCSSMQRLTYQSVSTSVTRHEVNGGSGVHAPYDCNRNRETMKIRFSRSGSLTPDDKRTPKFKRRAYSLHSFEPISPVTEICTLPWTINAKKTPDLNCNSTTDSCISISEDDVLITLAQAVRELADRKFAQHDYDEAQSLYEQSLSLLNRMFQHTGRFDLGIIAILKQCGLIRILRGDSLGAMGIFEQAISVVEGQSVDDTEVVVASLWYEMGNALIIEGKHSETVGHTVVTIIRDNETEDFLDAPRSVASNTDLEFSYNAFTSKGESYPVGAFEALACYKKAYFIIEKLRKDAVFTEHELSSKILLKVGDCSILIGDLEVATNFYENALDCFKASSTPYSLCDNAHVLVMIGFLHYSNARYGTALVMLQCAIIMFHRMESMNAEHERIEYALVLAIMCFTNYESGAYSKAVSTGLQARRIFEEIFGDEIRTTNETYTWLMAQTLFTVAKAYSNLNMLNNAVETLESTLDTFGSSTNLDRILKVRILELIGICFETKESLQEALDFYNKALEEYKQQAQLGYHSSSLEHTLLSRTANIHVSMRQYGEASANLDRSGFVGRDLEDDIRTDMVTLLQNLGATHTLAGHIQSAIDCYTECIEVFVEIHGQLNCDAALTVTNLATMHHVLCIQTNVKEKRLESSHLAEKYYKLAMDLNFSTCLALRYANFLNHQRSYVESILILQQLLDSDVDLSDIAFVGVEMILVPPLLQCECDDEEIVLPAVALTRYLLVASFRAIDQWRSAVCYVEDMVYEAFESEPIALSVIGYTLIELGVYTEAFYWFDQADRSSFYPSSSVAWENKLFCVAMELFRCLRRGFLFLYEHLHGFGSFRSHYPYIA